MLLFNKQEISYNVQRSPEGKCAIHYGEICQSHGHVQTLKAHSFCGVLFKIQNHCLHYVVTSGSKYHALLQWL